LAAYQIDQIDGKLEGNPDFEVLNHTYPDDENRMHWTCRVKHNPLTAGAIAVVIASLAAVVAIAWLVLKPIAYALLIREKRKAVQEVGPEILKGRLDLGTNWVTGIAGALAMYWLLSRWEGSRSSKGSPPSQRLY